MHSREEKIFPSVYVVQHMHTHTNCIRLVLKGKSGLSRCPEVDNYVYLQKEGAREREERQQTSHTRNFKLVYSMCMIFHVFWWGSCSFVRSFEIGMGNYSWKLWLAIIVLSPLVWLSIENHQYSWIFLEMKKVQIYSLKSSTKYVLELLLFGASSTGVYIGNNRDFQSGNN